MTLNIDPYHDWALARIAGAMHEDVQTLVRHAVRQWLAQNFHLAKDAKATLAEFAEQRSAPKGNIELHLEMGRKRADELRRAASQGGADNG